MRLSEHHHQITNLLEQYGIRPEIEPTGSGHVRFRWNAGGHPQKFTVAKTPSDWRAARNNVATVKRMLKEAGVTLPCEAPAPRARETADKTAIIAALETRIAQLEADMQMLLDRLTDPEPAIDSVQAVLFSDHGNGHGAAIGHDIVAPAPEPTPSPKPTREERQRARHAKCWLWRVLRYDDFLPVDVVAKAGGKTYGTTSVLLSNMKKLGYVEHRPRIGWRKHRKVELLGQVP
jgi:hypothetical protein